MSKKLFEHYCLYYKKRTDKKFLDKAVSLSQKSLKSLDELANPGHSVDLIHPQYLAKCVSDIAKDDAIFSCDVGTPTI
jgi:pyruvate dehydrogenase (quinone)